MTTFHPLIHHTVRARPRLFIGLALAVLAGVAIPADLVPLLSTRVLLAWNVGNCAYLVLVLEMIFSSTPEKIQRRARIQSESRYVMIALVILAALAAVAAIFAQLGTVKDAQGAVRMGHIALAAFTIVSSWAFTHTMFALHYAHDFYDAAAHHRPVGIAFPQTLDPQYGDFMYCAFIIGTSGQTADVSFTSKPMRRVALVHSVFSFFFNTTILAMTINIAASIL